MAQAPSVAIPKRLPLIIEPENRDESTLKDAKLINCYMERDRKTGDTWIFKRPGAEEYTNPTGGAATGQGLYNWQGDIYSIFNGHLYKGTTDKGVVDATNGVYRWSSCLGATKKLQLGNGVKGYNYDDANGLVQITDPDFPAAFVKGWSFLDGTTYVGTSAGNIQGDEINTPTAWDPLNTIQAQIEPDAGMALAKQLVYTIMVKQWSTEVFYDAGNPTGSPLGTVQGAKANYGTISGDSVQDIEGTLCWLATTRAGGVQVMAFENLKVNIVSTKAVERILADADYSNVFSWKARIDGHRWYVFTLTASNITLVYDLDEQMWWEWQDSNGNCLAAVAATYNSTTTETYVQHASTGKIYLFDSELVTDDGDTITCDIYTPNFDGGTRTAKQCSRIEIIGDQTEGSVIQVRTNDADYARDKWTNFRNFDMSQRRPYVRDWGSFDRRVHHLRHACPTRMRIQAVELMMDIGTV